MSKKLRTTLLVILSCLTLVSTALAVGCSKKSGASDAELVKIELRENKNSYRIGDKVDAYDFFVRNNGVTYTFEIQKSTEDNKIKLATNIYQVNEEGDYTLTCNSSIGDETDNKSVNFTVIPVAPFVVVSSETRNVDLNDEHYISDIERWAKANTFTYGDDCLFYTDYLEYFEDEFDTTAEKIEYASGQKKFKFDKEGLYLFHFVLKNDGGESYGQYRVMCTEDLSQVTELPNAISFNKSNYTVTWDAVGGASQYKVKVGTKFILTQNTSLDITSIIPPSEFKYFDVVVLPLDASGEKTGKITVKDVIINPVGYGDQVILSRNTSVDAQNKTAVVTSTYTADATYAKLQQVNNDYLGFFGDFGVGYYVDFEFTGNNLPNVMLFADTIDGNFTGNPDGSGKKGVILMNGITLDGGRFMADHLRVYGPNRISDTYWNNTDVLFTTSATYEQDNRNMFSLDYLADNPNDQFKYVVGSFEDVDHNVYLDIYLYKKNLQGDYEIAKTENGVTYHITRSIGLKTSDLTGRHIVVYPGLKGLGQTCEFKFSLPEYKGDELKPQSLKDNAVSNEAVFYEDGAYALREDNCFTALAPGKEPVEGNKYLPDAYETLQNGYIGFKNGYQLGDYIKITFEPSVAQGVTRGDNMPNVILFSNNFNPGFTSISGDGILITGGIDVCNRVYPCANNNRMLIYGPNRMPNKTSFGSANNLVDGNFLYDYHPLFTQQGLFEQSEGKFAYVLGSYESASGTVVLDINVYHYYEDANGKVSKIVGVNSRCYDTGISVSALGGSNLLLTASNRQGTWDAYTEFKLDFCTDRVDAFKDFEVEGNARVKGDGTLSTTSGSVALVEDNFYAGNTNFQNAIATMQNGYVGLKGDYGVGTYVRINFTTTDYRQPTERSITDSEEDGAEPKEKIVAVTAENNPLGEIVYAYPRKGDDGKWLTKYVSSAGKNKFAYYYTDYHDRYDMIFADYDNQAYGPETYADNMPNVILFADKLNSGFTSASGNGLFISSGTDSCNPQYKPSGYNSNLVIHGPNRISDKTAYNSGALKSYSYTTHPLFTQWGLAHESQGDFTYIVGTYLSATNTVVLDMAIYQEINGVLVATNSLTYDTGILASEFTGRGIVLSATNKLATYGAETTFDYQVFTDKASATPERFNVAGTFSKNADGSVTLYNGAHVKDAATFKSEENAYLALKGDYGVGTYVDVIFSSSSEPNNGVATDYGNDNIPNVMFFVDDKDINGYKGPNGGSGVIILNGIGFYNNTDKTSNNLSNVKVFGPTRMTSSSNRFDSDWLGFLSYNDCPLLTQRGLIEDQTDSVYKYTVGTFKNGEGKLVIDLSLSRQNGTGWDVVYESVQIVTALDADDMTAGNIVFLAENKQLVWEATTTFKYSAPYTK